MLSDIALKGVGLLQLSLYESFRDFSGNASIVVRVPIAAGLCVTDVVLDTLKYPIIAIEHIFSAAINALGAACADRYLLADARHLLKSAAFNVTATWTSLLIAIPRAIYQLYKVIQDCRHATSCNQFAESESKMAWVVTDKQQCQKLHQQVSRIPTHWNNERGVYV